MDECPVFDLKTSLLLLISIKYMFLRSSVKEINLSSGLKLTGAFPLNSEISLKFVNSISFIF